MWLKIILCKSLEVDFFQRKPAQKEFNHEEIDSDVQESKAFHVQELSEDSSTHWVKFF